MSQIDTSKQAVYDYCKTMLGDGMVDVELDPTHYETALNRSLAVFRQRSDNAVEESYIFLNLLPDTNEYILPKEIQQVRQIIRRSVGSRTGGGRTGRRIARGVAGRHLMRPRGHGRSDAAPDQGS